MTVLNKNIEPIKICTIYVIIIFWQFPTKFKSWSLIKLKNIYKYHLFQKVKYK